jgi:hypothetical protein
MGMSPSTSAMVRWRVRIAHFQTGPDYVGGQWKEFTQFDLRSPKRKCKRNRDVDLYINGAYAGQLFTDSSGHFSDERPADPQGTWKIKIDKGGDGAGGCGGARKIFNVSHQP